MSKFSAVLVLIILKFPNLPWRNLPFSEFNTGSEELKVVLKEEFMEIGSKILKVNIFRRFEDFLYVSCLRQMCCTLLYNLPIHDIDEEKHISLFGSSIPPSRCLREMLNSERWVINNHNGDESVKRDRSGSFQLHPPDLYLLIDPPTFHTQHSHYSTLRARC